MWENAQTMAALADWIAAAAMIALAYAGVLAVLRLPIAPLRSLVVTSGLRHVTAEQIEYAARTSLAGNFFSVRMDRLRAAFEKLPWVRHVELRRRWPGGIEVEIEEHVAAAVWNPGLDSARLVNEHGEVFSAAVPGAPLPLLSGPEGSAPELLRRQREFAAILAPLARSPRSVTLSARAAWQLRLDDGVVIELGRDQPGTPVGERLRRFVAHYREAAARLPAPIAAADLRYPAGFAVRTAAHGTQTKADR
ncbi:MAG: cell division protein FtsQ/DivIB [Rhodocyclaceae bacterium]